MLPKMDINVLLINVQRNKNFSKKEHARTAPVLLTLTLKGKNALLPIAQKVKLIKNLMEVVESAQIILSNLKTRDPVRKRNALILKNG